jgi:SanA protein
MPFRRRLKILGGLALLCALPPLCCDVLVGRAGPVYRDPLELLPAPVGLVLGTSPRFSGRPNLYYQTRLDAAEALYRSGRVQRLLLSGDGQHKSYDETLSMQQDLLARGLPQAALLRDPSGLRTLDSLENARDIFGVEHLIVVSQEFHARRALYLAQRLGLRAQGLAGARSKAVLECLLETRP